MVVQIKFLYIYRSNVTTIYNLFPSELWLVSELYSVLSRISFSFLSLFFNCIPIRITSKSLHREESEKHKFSRSAQYILKSASWLKIMVCLAKK